MRRIFAIALTVAALSAAAALFTSPAGGQSEGEFASFEIIKDIHGEGPTGGFVIEYTCVDDEGDVTQSDTLNFDAAGPGADEVQVINVNTSSTCTIDETNANGADLVEYECEFFPGEPPSVDASVEGFDPGSCLDEQSAEFTARGDFGSFLVRNTFDADVPPVEEPPVVDPDVVTATPPFTG